MEGDCKREPFGIAIGVDNLEGYSLELPVLEGDGIIENVVRGAPARRRSCIVGISSVSLAEAGLVTLLEVILLDRNCGGISVNSLCLGAIDLPAGCTRHTSAANKANSAVHLEDNGIALVVMAATM